MTNKSRSSNPVNRLCSFVPDLSKAGRKAAKAARKAKNATGKPAVLVDEVDDPAARAAYNKREDERIEAMAEIQRIKALAGVL